MVKSIPGDPPAANGRGDNWIETDSKMKKRCNLRKRCQKAIKKEKKKKKKKKKKEGKKKKTRKKREKKNKKKKKKKTKKEKCGGSQGWEITDDCSLSHFDIKPQPKKEPKGKYNLNKTGGCRGVRDLKGWGSSMRKQCKGTGIGRTAHVCGLVPGRRGTRTSSDYLFFGWAGGQEGGKKYAEAGVPAKHQEI